MRKYKILVLTDIIHEAHKAVLDNTFGKRPYAGVTSRTTEMILKYDDAEVTIKRCNGDSMSIMHGCRWDEVWIDEHLTVSEELREFLRSTLQTVGIYKKEIQETLPHYANRTKINYFKKWD